MTECSSRKRCLPIDSRLDESVSAVPVKEGLVGCFRCLDIAYSPIWLMQMPPLIASVHIHYATKSATLPKLKYNSIEVCRGIAACLVVASHATGTISHHFGKSPFSEVFGVGYVGVDFFFVLSGFIIAAVHADDSGRPARFATFVWKRFVRIFPAYWIVLAGILATHFLLPSIIGTHHHSQEAILKSIVLWPESDSENILSVAWTLSYELLFYAVFSITIFERRIGVAVFFFWQLAVVLANLKGNPTAYSLQLINIDFLLGVAVAWLPIFRFGKWCIGLGVISFLMAAATAAADFPLMQTRFSVLAFGVSAALIVYGWKCVEQQPISMPVVPMLLGASSYSIYLVHYPVISASAKVISLAPKIPAALAFILVFVVGCAAGVVFHKAVDLPIRQQLRRIPNSR